MCMLHISTKQHWQAQENSLTSRYFLHLFRACLHSCHPRSAATYLHVLSNMVSQPSTAQPVFRFLLVVRTNTILPRCWMLPQIVET